MACSPDLIFFYVLQESEIDKNFDISQAQSTELSMKGEQLELELRQVKVLKDEIIGELFLNWLLFFNH